MLSANTSSSGRRSQVHTEVRAPVEVVISRVVYFVFGLIEVLIAIRFVLLLLGANIAAGFVQMVYGASGIFMAPFIAIFKTQRVASGAVFEWSALVAIAVYALIAWGAVALVGVVSPREQAQTVERTERDDDVRAP